MSAFDAKKLAQQKKDKLAKEAKARAKAEKDKGKAERQKQRLDDIKKKSEEGKALAQRKEMDRLKSMSAEDLEQERLALEYEEKLRIQKDEEGLRKKMIQQTLASSQGTEEIFKKKLTKEEKKAQQAAKRAAKKDKESSTDDSTSTTTSTSSTPTPTSTLPKKENKNLSKVAANQRELEAELEAARSTSIKARRDLGAFKGQIEAKSFTLPNPGGGANLLEDAACILVRGHCYGLIGRNGKGKSTLLKAIASRRVGDVPDNVTVNYVNQDVQLTSITENLTPVECVVNADLERTMLLAECAEFERKVDSGDYNAEDQKKHGECMEILEVIEADTANRRAEELVTNLGFSDELKGRKLKDLSGGWRVRTMLAAAIFSRPDMLLLDEPTNHLSISAVLWLSREIANNPVWKDRIVVIVSHDRSFLDEVCTDCLHISGAARRLTSSKGNYTLWSSRRADMKKLHDKQSALRAAKMNKLNDMADCGFRYGGSSSAINKKKQAELQSSKLLEEDEAAAEEAASLQEDIELPLELKSGGIIPGFVVNLKDLSFNYPDCPTLFSNVEYGITSESRIVLLGENGNGKTTLVKLITGELSPTAGEVVINGNARVALVNQHHADQIDMNLTPLQYMQSIYKAKPGVTGYDHLQSLRSHLAKCGVTSASDAKDGGEVVLEMQNTPCKALSGGQRSRVAFAGVSYKEPHVIVLDEPTNNLDLESVEALALAVKNFKGAILCVSHDQHFVETISNEAWVVGDGAVTKIESFRWYKDKCMRKLMKTDYEIVDRVVSAPETKKTSTQNVNKSQPKPAPTKPVAKKYTAPKASGGISLKAMAGKKGTKKKPSMGLFNVGAAKKKDEVVLKRGRFDNLDGGGGFEWTFDPNKGTK
ncbi:hypothetical protein TrLO_g238 [Triparma laevis f. longispina]|uniref:ABC transporter domain-containing protein n=1 Tax=Triparma laevis f. longispina TaxID=1714387 RepID=A0A9W7DYI4_9STRA|nr:hypothetical protein TrLO_g238 [Triparma laevis f. longispina]